MPDAEPPVVVQQDLMGTFVPAGDQRAVGRVSQANPHVDEAAQRVHVVGEHVADLRVVHDHRGNPREYVVAREEDPGAGVV